MARRSAGWRKRHNTDEFRFYLSVFLRFANNHYIISDYKLRWRNCFFKTFYDCAIAYANRFFHIIPTARDHKRRVYLYYLAKNTIRVYKIFSKKIRLESAARPAK